MEAGLDDGAFLTMLAASFVANLFTAMAFIGVVLFTRHERQAREEGRKVSAPPYVYALILLPATFAVLTFYAVNS